MVDISTKAGRGAFAGALAVVVIGMMVIIGWSFQIKVLKAPVAGTVTMNPATALAFVLGGTSLVLSLQAQSRRHFKSLFIWAARGCAAMVALMGVLRLAAIGFGWDIGVDQWLFPLQVSNQLPFPSRIAPNVAVNFLLLGGALLLADVRERSVRFLTEFSVIVVGLGSLLAILGYVYGIQSFYRLSDFIPMALHTGIAFSVLMFAFLLSHTDRGLLAIFAGDSAGGMIARRLLPAAVLVPAGLGWLTRQGEKEGIYSGDFAEALFAVGNILFFTILVSWSIQKLFLSDSRRKVAEEGLKRSQVLAHMAGRLSRMGAWSVEIPGFKVAFSDEVCAIHEVPPGFTPTVEEAIRFYAPEFIGPITEAFEACARHGTPFDIELQIITAKGRRIWVRSIGEAERDVAGVILRVQGAFQDITERKRLESQLIQSQKMETVGKLAGSVAHEFNSILTAIIGHSELLFEDLPSGDPLRSDVTQIRSAAERAATLTRQLLAFGRQQILRAEILDLNAVLAGMETTLRNLMRRDARLRIVLAAGLQAVKADAGQIEHVIMNMALNAADAMPRGGELTFETANVTLDQEEVSRFPEWEAGEYVMLAVADTGVGMSDAVKARVFEPFFSTKGVGQGTGLGLSTCYGIIKQSGGHVTFHSEVDRGAKFKIYLPPFKPLAMASTPRPDAQAMPPGTENILLVEDDPASRKIVAVL
jgi:signal transduction histidine kinase